MFYWNMTNGHEYEDERKYLEEAVKKISLKGYRTVEQIDSKYDAIEEKWYFYYRVLDEYGYSIYRIHL